jgi:hypothetical protein
MAVSYFRARRPGPELDVEDSLSNFFDAMIEAAGGSWWLGGSVPLGSGRPDFVAAQRADCLTALPTSSRDGVTLAYLRTVREAKLETIAARLRKCQRVAATELASLVSAGAVHCRSHTTFSLSPNWRNVLPRIVAVEAKVIDWKRALQQAARNRLFANLSYVALPQAVAGRPSLYTEARGLGIGVIAVDADGHASVTVDAIWQATKVWAYYYRLATLAAPSLDALPIPN